MPFPTLPNLSAAPEDRRLISRIVKRAIADCKAHGIAPDYNATQIDMDLTACHLNGCPLDLPKLLTAPSPHFLHDVLGIRRFLDRSTGQIPAEKFHPRCAAPDNAA